MAPKAHTLFRSLVFGFLASLFVQFAPGAGEGSAQSRRFNHAKHEDNVPKCTSCHAMSAKTGWIEKRKVGTGRGGNEHRPCSNGGCHAGSWGSLTPGGFCWTCHQGSLRNVKYPPYRQRGESDFWLQPFTHTDHIQKQETACTKCHTQSAPKRRRRSKSLPLDMRASGHRECATNECHGSANATPPMSECKGCHTMRDGTEVAKRHAAVWDNYRVGLAFDHQQHTKASGESACKTCHNNTTTGPGEAVPLPLMKTCEGCHNGTRAFDALGHQCRTCHLVPAGGFRR